MSKARIYKDTNTSDYGMPTFEEHEPVVGDTIGAEGSPEDIEKEAYRRGYEAGETAGFEVGKKKAEVLIKGLEEALIELRQFREEIIDQISPRVFDLSVAIARKILREELKEHPEHLVHLIKEALKKIQRIGTVTVRVHPMLYDLIETSSEEIKSVHPDIKIESDPSVAPTGPIVTGPVEEVLIDYDSQINNLLEDLGRNDGNSHS